MTLPPRGIMQRALGGAWRELKVFCGIAGDATYIWTRWILIRAVGLVYVLMFCGIIEEGQALIGPNGLAPVGNVFAALAKQSPNPIEAFLRTPSLFWLSTSADMVTFLSWLGLAAAVAVVLNIWPRLSLFVAWLVFLSFAVSGPFFSKTAPDPLMLEVALLCIPFAPPGRWPGLAVNAAPRPIALFALRWMLLRLMIEAGLSKFVYGCDLWRNLTAMDYMYQSAPFPTILGYWDFQLPHAYHVFEIGLTFVAEIIAPVLAIFGGRGWKWFVFAIWAAFQIGIELTNNFGWLQVAAIALAVVLLDDQMLIRASRRLHLRRLADYLARSVALVSARGIRPGALWGLRVALGLQMALTLFFYVIAPARIHIENVPRAITRPIVLLFGGWYSANPYPLFGTLLTYRDEVEYIGSNDGGETWRSYDFRYQAQRVDRLCPFVAPWYPRLEAILQTTMLTSNDPALYQTVAAHLLQRDPALLKLFRRDPFPDRPATMIRTATYRLTFTDLPTLRQTGNYWHKEYEGDYAPMLYLNEHGETVGLGE